MRTSPIKVRKSTYERVRYAAAVVECSQADLVEAAVAEYIENHVSDLRTGIERLEATLLKGAQEKAREKPARSLAS